MFMSKLKPSHLGDLLLRSRNKFKRSCAHGRIEHCISDYAAGEGLGRVCALDSCTISCVRELISGLQLCNAGLTCVMPCNGQV
jgi:hypothetical protein